MVFGLIFLFVVCCVMQTFFKVSVLLLLIIVCSAEHTVHVDNVFPNFGDTVLVSGPFTTGMYFAFCICHCIFSNTSNQITLQLKPSM